MRLIDSDALIESLRKMYRAAEKWEYDAKDEEIKIRAESCMAGLVEVKLRIEGTPTIDPVKWIPVTERLPEEGVQVLVTDDAGGLATIDVDCGYFDEEYGRFEWFHSQNVTAWMPLPEPWRGEEDDNK